MDISVLKELHIKYLVQQVLTDLLLYLVWMKLLVFNVLRVITVLEWSTQQHLHLLQFHVKLDFTATLVLDILAFVKQEIIALKLLLEIQLSIQLIQMTLLSLHAQ